MENKLSNDIFRNFMLKSIFNDNSINCTEIDENVFIYSYVQKLKTLYLEGNEIIYAFYNGIISVAYLDAYKVLNAKLRDSNITFEELQTYNKLSTIFGIEDLQYKLDNDPWLLEEIFKYSLEFIRMNDLRKISTLKKLSEAQKHILKTEFELFKNDLNQYDFKEKIPLEVLTDYYEKEISLEENVVGINDPGQTSFNLMQEIIGFIRMLVGNDYECFKLLMNDIIILDYKWNKFIIDKNYKFDTFRMENIDYRKSLFEENSLDSLIEECLYDSSYFEELIDALILIKCDNMYVDEELINQDIVEKHYELTLNKKLK